MSAESPSPAALVSTRAEGDRIEVSLAGEWRLTGACPEWTGGQGFPTPVATLRFRDGGLGYWDTSLLLYVFDAQEWCQAAGIACDTTGLPEKARALLAQLGTSHPSTVPHERTDSFLVMTGLATRQAWSNLNDILHFVGECALGAASLPRRSRKFRWRDCIDQMQECGAMGLPIVSLISFLVGLTLAYQAAVELRQFGADIFVADVVGLSTVREMGPMMVAVILAGRTGAAFAATLGNMKANEEIDALETLGISAVDFLVLPRLLALGLMMPLLALYANCVGILGGMVVAAGILQIPPSAYWIETQGAISLSDINTGLLKATTFGLLIGLSGCLRGLQAERSAAGVGRAATSAVVTAILLIIVADSIYAVLFHILGV
jgi:phospholipid/cholesterol/gamma-HCH transport system permease protein